MPIRIRAAFILKEQIREMEAYRWIRSQECGYDVGEYAYSCWVEKYAAEFRAWSESIPAECVGCGACVLGGDGSECQNPFNLRRKQRLRDMGFS